LITLDFLFLRNSFKTSSS